MKKWMYKGNSGLLAVDGQIEILKDYFDQKRPDSLKDFKNISFTEASKMIKEVKSLVEKEIIQEQVELVIEETAKPKKRVRPKKEK